MRAYKKVYRIHEFVLHTYHSCRYINTVLVLYIDQYAVRESFCVRKDTRKELYYIIINELCKSNNSHMTTNLNSNRL